jgi:phosphoglycolate phosphatase
VRYELIVFDWDGTIMDSTSLIAECIQLAAGDCGLPVPAVSEAKAIIGLGLHESTRRLFPDLPDDERMQFALRYRHHYVPRDHEAPLYAGIDRLLSGLAQPERFLAVATGKPRAGLERAFRYSGLRHHFHFSRCGDEGFPKPHPDMLLWLMDAAQVEPAQVLMIGDTSHDLELARNAGADALAVTYGAHPREQFSRHEPLAVVDNVGELEQWLTRNA